MKLRRMIVLTLTVALTAGLMACSSKNNNNAASQTPQASQPSSTQSSTPAATESAAPTNQGPDLSKKISISLVDGTWESPVPAPGGAGLLQINEKFNVELDAQFVSYDDYADKLPVLVASGDLPDMIGMEVVDSNFVKWAKQGAFLPLNDYVAQDQYETFKIVPQAVWDAVSVEGEIYAIPQYFPDKYLKKPIIRKDWLDALNLPMPTNYEELVKVAIAFTTQDPDGNGQNDTYGLGLSKDVVYGAWMGVQWDRDAWYHKNEQGQLIPGYLSEHYKTTIQALADMYKAGAVLKDWALMSVRDARNDFFAGKSGIFYEQAYDIGPSRFQALKEIHPSAELVTIPAFVGEDGQQGFTAGSGYYQLVALNAKLKDDPDKVNRILHIEDYFRKFIPPGERNEQNPDYDWLNGGLGVGYTMENGFPVTVPDSLDLRPSVFITSRGWAPTNEANEPEKVINDPFTSGFVQGMVDLLTSTKFYINPVHRVHSEVKDAKEFEIYSTIIIEDVTKMIVGNIPVSDWDKMVQEFLGKGGQEIIDDVNAQLQKAGISGEWQ